MSAMIRGGVSLARSVELAVQWDGILRVGPIHPITADDFLLARGEDLGQCCQVVQGLHRRLSDFIRGVVVHRRSYSWLERVVAGRSSCSSLQVAQA